MSQETNIREDIMFCETKLNFQSKRLVVSSDITSSWKEMFVSSDITSSWKEMLQWS